ncbi:MAG: class I SAM-dependent methyltransferase [Chloroflexi bacterium]|nr:class I SAM-dependent methyltransferase [Chloroflexota bacterium]
MRNLSEHKPILSDWTEYFQRRKVTLFSEAIGLEKFFRAITQFVPEKTSILEVGFGTGLPAIMLTEMGYQVTAIDIDSGLARSLYQKKRGLASHLNVMRADMFHLPFKDNSFYAVISQGVLEHFPEQDICRALSEQRRVASQLVILDVPNDRFPQDAGVLPGSHLDWQPRSRQNWKAIIQECGLSPKYEYGVGLRPGRFWHYLYFALPYVFHYWDRMRTRRPYSMLGCWFGSINGFVAKVSKSEFHNR